jgi:hypothetical protein
MLEWIKVIFNSKEIAQDLVLAPADIEVPQREPAAPSSQLISESGKVVQGPGFNHVDSSFYRR